MVAWFALKLLPSRMGLVAAVVLVAAASYFALVTLANRTTVRATREWLQASHGPIPVVGRDLMDPLGFWPDVHDVAVSTSRVMRVAKGERETMQISSETDDALTKVYLKAVFHDGVDAVDVQLLPSTASPAVEDFVGWHLDQWLRRADLPHYRGAEFR